MSFLWDLVSPFTVIALLLTTVAHPLGVVAFVFGRRIASRGGRIAIGSAAIAFGVLAGAIAALGGVAAIVRANQLAEAEPELHDMLLESGRDEAGLYLALASPSPSFPSYSARWGCERLRPLRDQPRRAPRGTRPPSPPTPARAILDPMPLTNAAMKDQDFVQGTQPLPDT